VEIPTQAAVKAPEDMASRASPTINALPVVLFNRDRSQPLLLSASPEQFDNPPCAEYFDVLTIRRVRLFYTIPLVKGKTPLGSSSCASSARRSNEVKGICMSLKRITERLRVLVSSPSNFGNGRRCCCWICRL
jgi:hypothetical protein